MHRPSFAWNHTCIHSLGGRSGSDPAWVCPNMLYPIPSTEVDPLLRQTHIRFSFGKSPIYGWSIQKQFLIILRCPKFSDKPITFPSCIAYIYISLYIPVPIVFPWYGGVRKWGIPNCWMFFFGKYIYTLNKINGWFGDTMTKRTPHNHPSRIPAHNSISHLHQCYGQHHRTADPPSHVALDRMDRIPLWLFVTGRCPFCHGHVIPPNHPSHGWLF